LKKRAERKGEIMSRYRRRDKWREMREINKTLGEGCLKKNLKKEVYIILGEKNERMGEKLVEINLEIQELVKERDVRMGERS